MSKVIFSEEAKGGPAAERASCWLWSRREELSWKLGEDGQ